ncbi:hypothetical protein VNO77_31167 [Canavalia gladiata]|uniref:Uncharacterized protein n=1 Tax=Canavalia gladiata TaxID=3824 RepID=A0AAN9KRQ6_CANGL
MVYPSTQFYRVRVTHHSDLSLECGPANRPDPEGLTICQLMEGILISKVPAGLLPPGSGSGPSLKILVHSLPLHPSVQGQCRVSILPYTFKSLCNWLMNIKSRIYGQPIPPFRLSSFRHLQVGLRSFEDRPHLSSAGPNEVVLALLCIYYVSIVPLIRTGQAVSLIRLTSIIFEVFYQHLSRLSSLLIRSLINGGEKHDHILEAVTFQQLFKNNFFLHEAESNDTGFAVSGVMVVVAARGR